MKFTLEVYLDNKEINENTTVKSVAEIGHYLIEARDTIEHHFLILKMKKQGGTVRDKQGQITGYWEIK